MTERRRARPRIVLTIALACSIAVAGCANDANNAISSASDDRESFVVMPQPAPTADDATVTTEYVAWRMRPSLVTTTNHDLFAIVNDIELFHPVSRVYTVGFHQSSHEGAQQLEPQTTTANPRTLASRGRRTALRTAADVVGSPDEVVLAPVTGTVKRAGSYVLYCDHRDEFLVIAPDAAPSWEVKLLHVRGLRVAPGDHVEAGATRVADGLRTLPFTSQVDKHTPEPSWPHGHIEVVDPSIPNIPSPGGGC